MLFPGATVLKGTSQMQKRTNPLELKIETERKQGNDAPVYAAKAAKEDSVAATSEPVGVSLATEERVVYTSLRGDDSSVHQTQQSSKTTDTASARKTAAAERKPKSTASHAKSAGKVAEGSTAPKSAMEAGCETEDVSRKATATKDATAQARREGTVTEDTKEEGIAENAEAEVVVPPTYKTEEQQPVDNFSNRGSTAPKTSYQDVPSERIRGGRGGQERKVETAWDDAEGVASLQHAVEDAITEVEEETVSALPDGPTGELPEEENHTGATVSPAEEDGVSRQMIARFHFSGHINRKVTLTRLSADLCQLAKAMHPNQKLGTIIENALLTRLYLENQEAFDVLDMRIEERGGHIKC